MKASEYLIRDLQERGVEYIFGLSGTTNTEILDAIYRIGKIHFITVRHEQAAVGMADGYARVTGKPGVCLVHAGAGATNAITGVACAYRDSIPLLLLTGNEQRDRLGREVVHEIDHVGLFRPVTKFSVRLERESDLHKALNKAIRISLSGRPGPVHLDLPLDLMKKEVRDLSPGKHPMPKPRFRKIGSDLIEKTWELLQQSSKPLLLAGEGAVWSSAEEELIHFAERFSIPVVTNDESRGCLPEDHSLHMGVVGRFGRGRANLAMEETDLLLALGSRLDDMTTLNWTVPVKGTRIIQIYPDKKEIGRQIPIEMGIAGSVREFLRSMLKDPGTLPPNSWEVNQWNNVRRVEREDLLDSVPINPQRVIRDLKDLLGEDTIITVGSGLHTSFASELMIRRPRSFIRSVGLGAMGFAFPAAMGARIAFPRRRVVALVGDGDFFMTLPDLETAARLGISILIIIFNNHSYGAIKLRQTINYESRYIGVDYGNPDLAQLAELFGAKGRRVERPEDLRPALEEGLKSEKPFLVDVIIDPKVLPPGFSGSKSAQLPDP